MSVEDSEVLAIESRLFQLIVLCDSLQNDPMSRAAYQPDDQGHSLKESNLLLHLRCESHKSRADGLF